MLITLYSVDLVFAATAWHWSATHVIPHGGDPFFREIQRVYEDIGEGVPDGWVPIRPGQLLDTFSGHIAMDTPKREHLCSEIRRRLATRSDGRLRRHWGAVLQVACPAAPYRSPVS